jgi:hypothetical protein
MSQVTFGNLSAATKTLIKGPYRLPWMPFKYPREAESTPKINSSVTYITACRFTIRKPQSLSRDCIAFYLLLPPGQVREPHLNGGFMTMPPVWPAFQHLPFRQCSLLPTTFAGLADGNEESPGSAYRACCCPTMGRRRTLMLQGPSAHRVHTKSAAPTTRVNFLPRIRLSPR